MKSNPNKFPSSLVSIASISDVFTHFSTTGNPLSYCVACDKITLTSLSEVLTLHKISLVSNAKSEITSIFLLFVAFSIIGPRNIVVKSRLSKSSLFTLTTNELISNFCFLKSSIVNCE